MLGTRAHLSRRNPGPTARAQVLYFPSGSAIQAYEVMTGHQPATLRGHMATINACCWNKRLGELYSGATDHNILVWSVPVRTDAVTDDAPPDPECSDDVDAWSDDEDGDGASGVRTSGMAALGFASRYATAEMLVAQAAATAAVREGRGVSSRGRGARGRRRAVGGGRMGVAWPRRGRGGAYQGFRGGRRGGRDGAQGEARIQRIAQRLTDALVRAQRANGPQQ